MDKHGAELKDLFAPAADEEIVIAQAQPGSGPGAASPTASEDAGSPLVSSAADGDRIVAPPAPGEQLRLPVEPGSTIRLDDPAFAPATARYEVFDADLVITLDNDAVLVLEQFFDEENQSARIGLLGNPAVAPADLLSQTAVASLDRADAIEPAAGGPEGGPDGDGGGGANFSPYDQGSLPPGLDPIGPQPPVSLNFGVDFLDPPTDIPPGDEDGDPADLAAASTDPTDPTDPGDPADLAAAPADPTDPTDPPPPANISPLVTLQAEIAGTVAEASTSFPPTSAADFPVRGNRRPISSGDINNVDQGNLTIPPALEGSDGAREIRVTLDGRTNSSFGNTLGFYTIAEDGTITDPRIVFANENNFPAGTAVSLGTFPPGTEIGFFVVARGGDFNAPELFQSGTLKFVNPATGELANIADNATPFRPDGVPDLIHVDAQGNETAIRGTIYHTADESQGSTLSNRLNPDMLTHAVSGLDPKTSNLVIGIEDQNRLGDRDFDDVVFQVSIGDAVGQTLFVADQGGILAVDIVDPDSDFLSEATAAIVEGSQTGDRLTLAGLDVDPATGRIAGTNIDLAADPSGNRLTLSGEDTIQNYEAVLDAVRLGSTATTVDAGTRTVEVTVTDSEGATSAPQRSDFVIENRLQLGGDANDIFDGNDGVDALSGRGGDDQLRGFGGDDILLGGSGRDALRGGDGNDLLIGGGNADSLSGNAGADTFRYTAISDARDRITDFNADEGDRLDISDLIDQAQTVTGTTITQANIDQFFRLEAQGNAVDLVADLDGNGGKFTEVTLARLDNPTGVDTSDIASVVANPPSDGATS